MKNRTETFELTVDGKAMTISATAYKNANHETHYRVSIDDSAIHIFAANENLRRFADIEAGTKAEPIPVNIEKAIGDHLYQLYQRQAA